MAKAVIRLFVIGIVVFVLFLLILSLRSCYFTVIKSLRYI